MAKFDLTETMLSQKIREQLNKHDDIKPRPALRVLNAMLAEHWLMMPESLDQMMQIALRLNESPEAVSAKLGRPLDNTQSVTVRDGVAIVPLTGPIFRHANMMTEVSGATSLQRFVQDLKTADNDASVRGIIIDADTPGGQAAGIADAATIIRNLSKPVVAYADSLIASAGYWLGAAADELVLSRAAMAGNVGVVVTAYTKKKEGTIEIVSSRAPKKRPDISTESGRAQVQGLVDDLESVFIEDVAALRGLDVDTVAAWGGDVLIGQKAVEAGVADRLGDIESIIAGMTGSTKRSVAMTGKTTTTSPEITREHIAAEHPAIADAFRTEGAQAFQEDETALLALPAVAQAISDARTDAATAERARIQEVEAQGKKLPGFEAEIERLKYDGSTTGADAAVALLEANSKKIGDLRNDMREEAPDPLPAASEPEAKQSESFEAKVEQFIDAGMSRGNAMSAAAREFPELHKKWLARINSTKAS